MPEPRRRKLEKALHDERAVRNSVVRDALVRGEAPLVARWVRELGDFLLEDLRGDAAAAPALAQLASEVVRAGPDPAALSELEGRVIAARLSRATESADAAFAFLEGVRPDAFAAACRDLSPGALDAVLRFAPPRLRTAALEDMPPEQRRELAFSWARRPEVPASYAIAAADELRERLGRVAGGPQHAERALSDLLDSLPREEQDALIERLRREEGGKVAATLLTESALLGAPGEVVAATVLALPPARIVDYLAGADEALRDRVLAACPARLRGELEEELRMRGSQPEAQFHAARRELIARLRDETSRRGIPATEVRAWSRRAPERARLVSTAE
jgi:flagellar motor switch protein FliG